VQSWNLLEIDTPDGSRSPVVLHSHDGEARAVLIGLKPGQQLGNHQVTEAAWLVVVEGSAVVEGDGERVDVGPGMLFRFDRPSATRSRASRARGCCCCSRRGPARDTTAVTRPASASAVPCPCA
jgi:hypothetical protein